MGHGVSCPPFAGMTQIRFDGRNLAVSSQSTNGLPCLDSVYAFLASRIFRLQRRLFAMGYTPKYAHCGIRKRFLRNPWWL